LIKKKERVFLLSLGCAKNLVDSEMMTGLLQTRHFIITREPQEADVIVVNTCGFIREAKEEAIAAILQLAEYKEKGNCRLLIAVGCMLEKYKEEMLKSMPEIDAALGTKEYHLIADLIEGNSDQMQADKAMPEDFFQLRQLATPSYLAYLKIAEGCNNCCSYCLIPQLRGPLRSRPMEKILEEAKALAASGVRELIIIAQDTTIYGYDIYGRPMLSSLLDKLAALPFIWIRLLYAYPSRIDEGLLQVMKRHKNICHYLDMPMQHADDRMLSSMNRQGTRREIKEKIELIRSYMPDIALRTTMMVGFPGEKKEQWLSMLDFLREADFDWVGVFAYSREKDTSADKFSAHVRRDVKESRKESTMALLADLTAQRQKRHIGKTLLVLTEGPVEGEEGLYYGRCQYQAPEVDGVVYFRADRAKAGEFYEVRISGSDVYDLIGERI